MDKYEFNCNQLKNIEVPKQWVNKALEIPSKAPKAAPQKSYYRYVAAIAASVVLTSAVIIFVMFGMNKNVNLTNPISDSPSKSDSFNSESKPDSTDNTNPSGKSPAFSGAENSPSEFITEPSENDGGAVSNYYIHSSQAADNTKETKAQNNTKPNKESSKPSETSPEPSGEAPEPTEEQETVNIKMIDTDDWAIGALPDDTPKPTRPSVSEAYGCRFLTSVDRNIAKGKTYYCRVEDETGKALGSGVTQIDDWGNPDWQLDVKYTADFVLYYDRNYTVTFYSSDGDILRSGIVYLQQGVDYYLLY